MDDCPAVLSLGARCSKEAWIYEWKYGQQPTLSKGSRRIVLIPQQDAPMVVAAQNSDISQARSEAKSQMRSKKLSQKLSKSPNPRLDGKRNV